jgi:hypothetical protein
MHVSARQRAQLPFWQENPGRKYGFLLSEAALRSGCDVEQIERLFEADSLDHATVKYLPFDSGPPSRLTLPFILLSFEGEEDPDIVYVEAPDAHLYFEEAESVQNYRMGLEASEGQARSIKEFKQ